MTHHRSRLLQFVIDVDDLDRGVAFWSAALDATEEPLSERSRPIYRLLRLPDAEIRVLLQRTDEGLLERMHLDLETDDIEAEVQRLEALARPAMTISRSAALTSGHARPLGQRVLRAPPQLPRAARSGAAMDYLAVPPSSWRRAMTRVLIQVIAQAAVFLEFADEATLHPDAAVKQLEALAFQLQQLTPTERQEFIRLLSEVADEWPTERERQYLLNLLTAIGVA